MKFKRMSELNLKNQRVFIRSDLNVPQDEFGNITDDTRIRASLEAIRFAVQAGAAVMVTSHLGRPKEGILTAIDSLQPIAECLARHLGQPVRLLNDWLNGVEVQSGEVVLLENCRCNRGEKADDAELAQQMAKLCDIYINDAFGTAHRAEATTHGIARFAKIAAAGPLLAAELDALSKAFLNPKRPLVAIVGGSKISTKISVLEALAEKVDHLIVGGGIANTFMLANGLPVGKSLVEEAMQDSAHKVIKSITARGGMVPIPIDVVVANEFSADAKAVIKLAKDVAADDLILDVGPETQKLFAKLLADAATIVWNGPIGVFEFPAFAAGTKALALSIASSPAYSLAGGGDTLAAIAQFNVGDQLDYISTGGGAFLEFLEGRTLPAVAALQARADG